jgi:hypothetical protein
MTDLPIIAYDVWDGNHMHLLRQLPPWANSPEFDGDAALVKRSDAMREIERLRKIEAAAQTIIVEWQRLGSQSFYDALDALETALKP